MTRYYDPDFPHRTDESWGRGESEYRRTKQVPDMFFFLSNNCIVSMEFRSREVRVAFPGESQLRQSRANQPTVLAAWVF